MSKVFFALITFSFIYSCEPRDYNITPIDSYAIYAYLTNTGSPDFIISKSSGLGYNEQPIAIENADLNIYNKNLSFSGFKQALPGKYSNQNFKPIPGENYLISAQIAENKLFCEINMPELVKFDFVDINVTDIHIQNTPAYCDTIYENDKNGNPTDKILYIDCHEETNDTITRISVIIDIDDPVIEGNYYYFCTIAPQLIEFRNFVPLGNAWSYDENTPSSFHSPEFNDKLLNKSNNLLTFSTVVVNSDWLKIELYSYNEYNYSYLNKNKIFYQKQAPLNKEEHNEIINFFKPGGTPESEPVILPCNIQGGIGTILSSTVFRDSIFLKKE